MLVVVKTGCSFNIDETDMNRHLLLSAVATQECHVVSQCARRPEHVVSPLRQSALGPHACGASRMPGFEGEKCSSETFFCSDTKFLGKGSEALSVLGLLMQVAWLHTNVRMPLVES